MDVKLLISEKILDSLKQNSRNVFFPLGKVAEGWKRKKNTNNI
jgi:hypothetical protein